MANYHYLIPYLILVSVLSACGGGGGGTDSPTPQLNLPDLPTPPVSALDITDNYAGFIIAKKPISTDPGSAASEQFSQRLYQIDEDNQISEVVLRDTDNAAIDLTGNLSFVSEEHIIPLDVMIMNEQYILLSLFSRDFDGNEENDYHNLLINLDDGNVVAAPVGLNTSGNSGRSFLSDPGRDYFPPDNRWNFTNDLYVISVDYDALGMMDTDYNPKYELIDHHNGVPCPNSTPTTDDATDDSSDDPAAEDDPAQEDAAPDEPAEDTESESQDSTSEDNQTCVDTVPLPEREQEPENSEEEEDDTEQESDLDGRTPTALYRMVLDDTNVYELIKVNLEDDRPDLGQFVALSDGTLIYRNADGGDNSYRVVQPDCPTITGRVSTVLIAPRTTLMIAQNRQGEEAVFEVSGNAISELIFTCNGDIIPKAYAAFDTTMEGLNLPLNSRSIAPYDYANPYIVNTRCQTIEAFENSGYLNVQTPLPLIPGLPSGDTRGLRKSQFLDGDLYCIGYDSASELTIMRLSPNTDPVSYSTLNFDFSDWLPDFDTIHMLSGDSVVFTGSSRTNPQLRTVIIDTDGNETVITDDLQGLQVLQQIEISPPAP